MNIEHYIAGREAGRSPWAIRLHGLSRIGEAKAMASSLMMIAEKPASRTPITVTGQQDGQVVLFQREMKTSF